MSLSIAAADHFLSAAEFQDAVVGSAKRGRRALGRCRFDTAPLWNEPMVATLLRIDGCEVTTVANGTEMVTALALASTTRFPRDGFDLIVTDVRREAANHFLAGMTR